MSRKVIYIILSYLLFFTTWCSAQSFYKFSGQILDCPGERAPSFRHYSHEIRWRQILRKYERRERQVQYHPYREQDTIHITVSYIGNEKQERSIDLTNNMSLIFSLKPSSTALREVVVTASESKGITSASKIDRTAMEHLQPTSFSDLLALLPGGKTSDPKMNGAKNITLREVGTSSSNYNNFFFRNQVHHWWCSHQYRCQYAAVAHWPQHDVWRI